MKKIYNTYQSNKLYFYILLFLYTEVITAFCTGFFISTLSVPSPGSPEHATDLSPLGQAISLSIYALGIILILTPVIYLTVKSIKNKIRIMQILTLWVCAITACILGLFLVLNVGSLAGNLAESLVTFLNDKFEIFITTYDPLM